MDGKGRLRPCFLGGGGGGAAATRASSLRRLKNASRGMTLLRPSLTLGSSLVARASLMRLTEHRHSLAASSSVSV